MIMDTDVLYHDLKKFVNVDEFSWYKARSIASDNTFHVIQFLTPAVENHA